MERKVTECHVTLNDTDGFRVTSTFTLSKPEHMAVCAQMIQGYIADRIVFTVSYS